MQKYIIDNSKYIDVKIIVLGYTYNKNQIKINVAKNLFFVLKTVFKFKLVSVRSNFMLYLFGCNTPYCSVLMWNLHYKGSGPK